MVTSAYIHIPFCKSKCHYCSFVSFNKLELKDEYLKALKTEIKYFYDDEVLKTIYFGGGTPSTLEINDFVQILKLLKPDSNAEITTELNPEGVNYDYARGLLDCGINRVSLGCQTFNDSILKQINRRHSAKQVENAVTVLQNAGFKNISLDFIYGLPNQTQEMFINDLKQAADLGIQHISLYGLKLEEGCFFYNHLPENLPDDDMQADMYLEAIETLSNLGFEHYEVSNFCKHGFESKHNLTYWNNDEYYGFGTSAHGYKNGIRYSNKNTLENYITNPIEHFEEKLLSQSEKLEEKIFLGLRKMQGINVAEINFQYNIDFENKYKKIIDKYLGLNLLKKTDEGYAFTPQGILVSNVVLADFIE